MAFATAPNDEGPTLEARLAARSRPQRPCVMLQRWEDLLFLHWRVPAAELQQRLPPGLKIDTFEGSAWLGLTAFFMRRVRPVGLPALPWISDFLELNVRTYVYDRAGVPGVWFFSLDCNRALAVWLAQLFFDLPYLRAAMQARRAQWIDYSSRRRGQREEARFRYRGIGPEEEAATGSLEFFLLERYFLFAPRRRGLLRGQVSHSPYRYRTVEVQTASRVPLVLDGFAGIRSAPAHSCVVNGLDVQIHAPEHDRT